MPGLLCRYTLISTIRSLYTPAYCRSRLIGRPTRGVGVGSRRESLRIVEEALGQKGASCLHKGLQSLLALLRIKYCVEVEVLVEVTQGSPGGFVPRTMSDDMRHILPSSTSVASL